VLDRLFCSLASSSCLRKYFYGLYSCWWLADLTFSCVSLRWVLFTLTIQWALLNEKCFFGSLRLAFLLVRREIANIEISVKPISTESKLGLLFAVNYHYCSRVKWSHPMPTMRRKKFFLAVHGPICAYRRSPQKSHVVAVFWWQRYLCDAVRFTTLVIRACSCLYIWLRVCYLWRCVSKNSYFWFVWGQQAQQKGLIWDNCAMGWRGNDWSRSAKETSKGLNE